MTELLTPTAAEAIKSRLARSRAGIERLSSAVFPYDLELIALSTESLNTALGLPGVSHPAYNLATISRRDALKNLQVALEGEISGAQVESTTDLIRAARELELAVVRAPALPRPWAPRR